MNVTKAAVLFDTNEPLRILLLTIPDLKQGQVLVRIKYSGICHTQLGECKGERGDDRFLPHCLGHEGSGVVEAVGDGVSKVMAGDKVILSWIRGTGSNGGPVRYLWNDIPVNAGPITTFQNYAVISEDRVTKIPNTFSLLYAALIGCAIPTGYGAVINVAQPRPGMSMAIFGCGGIGLCALMAAKISGCCPVFAVDTNDEKLTVAKEMGADYIINPFKTDSLSMIYQVCPDGPDCSIEATGITDVMEQALMCVKNQGGIATIIGNARFGDRLSFDPRQLNLGKQLRGTWGGDVIPDRDFPRIIRLIECGLMDPSFLISKIYSLDGINTALDDLENGRVIRPIIDMEQ